MSVVRPGSIVAPSLYPLASIVATCLPPCSTMATSLPFPDCNVATRLSPPAFIVATNLFHHGSIMATSLFPCGSIVATSLTLPRILVLSRPRVSLFLFLNMATSLSSPAPIVATSFSHPGRGQESLSPWFDHGQEAPPGWNVATSLFVLLLPRQRISFILILLWPRVSCGSIGTGMGETYGHNIPPLFSHSLKQTPSAPVTATL